MNQYYFGESRQYLIVEYAKTDRSSCKNLKCKKKIQKDDDHYNSKYYYHLQCFELKPRHLKNLGTTKIEEKVYDLDKLDDKDIQKVIQYLNDDLSRLRDGKKTVKKGKTQNLDEESKQNGAKNGKKLKKQGKSKNKRKSKQGDSDSESSYSESDSQEEIIPVKTKATKKGSKAKKINSVGYTLAQKQKFQQYFEQFDKLTIPQLKQILQKNHQIKTGTKCELVQKCADGKLQGSIPMCQQCGGGRLRYDRNTGIYSCPGYMEDTDFIRCNKKFGNTEIRRLPWIQ